MSPDRVRGLTVDSSEDWPVSAFLAASLPVCRPPVVLEPSFIRYRMSPSRVIRRAVSSVDSLFVEGVTTR